MDALHYVIYINATPQVVWDALRRGEPIVSVMPGTSMNATFERGSQYAYSGKTPDGKTMKYVWGTVAEAAAPRHIEMTYLSMAGPHESRVVYDLEEIAGKYTKLSVTQDRFQDGDPNYATNAEGWPQLLSNLKSAIETGKVMNYHA